MNQFAPFKPPSAMNSKTKRVRDHFYFKIIKNRKNDYLGDEQKFLCFNIKYINSN